MNAQTLKGQWNDIKGQLKQKYGQLTDQDLEFAEGNVDQLVGNIQKKTGQSRDQIEKYLDQLTADGGSAISQAGDRLQHAAHYAADQFRGGYDAASAEFSDRYGQAEHMIRSNPMQSVGTAFGIGVLVGVTVGVLLRQR